MLLSACRRAAEALAAPAPPAAVPDSDDSAGTFAQGPSRYPLPETEPVVRVRILKAHGDRGAADARRVIIGPADRWLHLRPLGERDRGIVVRAPVQVELAGPEWLLVDGQGYRPGLGGDRAVHIAPVRGESHELELEGRGYPGELRLVPRTDLRPGAFDVVSHVPLERYLPGVIAGELYRHWHPETFAAQAIAARSYAACEHAYFRDRRHFDLTNTTASQVYLGSVQHDRSRDAVNMTRGVVLAHEQWLVPGYYSSCCGGAAARAIDSIGPNPMNDIPPLHGRACGEDACAGSRWHRWTIDRAVDDLVPRLAAFGRARGMTDLGSLRTLAGIEVAARNHCGRPVRFAVSGGGSVRIELRAEHFRAAVNFTGDRIPPPGALLRSALVRIAISGGTVTFDGGGFGHGAGMCQHGAQAMAETGARHVEILARYYPGANLVRACGAT
jgi:stage II sporulation protein D